MENDIVTSPRPMNAKTVVICDWSVQLQEKDLTLIIQPKNQSVFTI